MLRNLKRTLQLAKPLVVKDLIKIRFHKNADGEYECRCFTKFSQTLLTSWPLRIRVKFFSYEAILDSNIKPKYWKELLTRDDIITIQREPKVTVSVDLEMIYSVFLASKKEVEGKAWADANGVHEKTVVKKPEPKSSSNDSNDSFVDEEEVVAKKAPVAPFV